MQFLQYQFALAQEFDMQAIRDRVQAKKALFSSYPGLAWKAWLLSSKEHGLPNAYAPLYLFNSDEALREFLYGPLFEGVTNTFGWPTCAAGLSVERGIADISKAHSCSVEIVEVTSAADLRSASRSDVFSIPTPLATCTMQDISRMCIRRYRFWEQHVSELSLDRRPDHLYEVAAISAPAQP
jgi:hypothetical protein